MKKLIVLALMASLAGCALPTSQVHTGEARPTLAVQGAPGGAELFIDGVSAGPAAAYDGVNHKVFIEEGVHRIELRQSGQTVLTQKIFASNGETSTVVFSSEGSK